MYSIFFWFLRSFVGSWTNFQHMHSVGHLLVGRLPGSDTNFFLEPCHRLQGSPQGPQHLWRSTQDPYRHVPSEIANKPIITQTTSLCGLRLLGAITEPPVESQLWKLSRLSVSWVGWATNSCPMDFGHRVSAQQDVLKEAHSDILDSAGHCLSNDETVNFLKNFKNKTCG